MSIAALQEASKELRRLAIAGSILAKDDFRIKKLIPTLQKSGEKVPVFARIAGALEELVSARESDTPAALLQAATLVNAVLYTQVQNRVEGEPAPLESFGITLQSRPSSAKSILAVIEALNTTGSGRLEVVVEAHNAGLFDDLRLLKAALNGFSDPYVDLADFMCKEVLPKYGGIIVPLVRRQFDPKGGPPDRRRLLLLLKLVSPEEARALFNEVIDAGDKEMRAVALQAVQRDPLCLDQILKLTKDRSDDVRIAACRALQYHRTPEATDALLRAVTTWVGNQVVESLKARLDDQLALRLIEITKGYIAKLKEGAKDYSVANCINPLYVLQYHRGEASLVYLMELYRDRDQLAQIGSTLRSGNTGKDLVVMVENALKANPDPRAQALVQ